MRPQHDPTRSQFPGPIAGLSTIEVCVFLICGLFPFCTASADCTDYGEYLHWLGAVGIGGFNNDVAVSGTLACLVGEYADPRTDGCFQVVDISDDMDPSVLGSMDLPGPAQGVDIQGTYAWIADGGYGLLAIDISEPRWPWQVGGISTPGSAV